MDQSLHALLNVGLSSHGLDISVPIVVVGTSDGVLDGELDVQREVLGDGKVLGINVEKIDGSGTSIT